MAKKKEEEPVYPEAPLIISREKFCELLSGQIKKGEELLRIEVPMIQPVNPYYGGFTNVRRSSGVEYDETAKNDFEAKYSRWNNKNKTIYRTSFSVAESIYFHEYESHIWNSVWGQDAIKDTKDEIKRLMNHMQGDIERSDLMKCQIPSAANVILEQKTGKAPMVFISHSSKDLEFVEALVTLLEGIGFDNKTLFCSSIPDYWIGLSKDIFASLRQLFTGHELYVIFIQSPRYYESAVSLNEMGAAWVLQTDYCSILTKDMQKEKMCGVFDDHTIFLKVDAPQVEARMNELKNTLTWMFHLPSMTDTTWERKRNTFLKAVNAIEYTEEPATSTSPLDDEYKRLQVEKLKQEAIEKKQAKIRGNIIEGRSRGTRILKIFNAGQSKARNVTVEWLNPDDMVAVQWDFKTLEEISPQNGRSFNMVLCEGHADIMRLLYTWSDDNKENNTYEEDVQL